MRCRMRVRSIDVWGTFFFGALIRAGGTARGSVSEMGGGSVRAVVGCIGAKYLFGWLKRKVGSSFEPINWRPKSEDRKPERGELTHRHETLFPVPGCSRPPARDPSGRTRYPRVVPLAVSLGSAPLSGFLNPALVNPPRPRLCLLPMITT